MPKDTRDTPVKCGLQGSFFTGVKLASFQPSRQSVLTCQTVLHAPAIVFKFEKAASTERSIIQSIQLKKYFFTLVATSLTQFVELLKQTST